MVNNFPAHIRFYDLLFDRSEDIRTLIFTLPCMHLEDMLAVSPFSRASLSEVIEFGSFDKLTVLRDGARNANFKGLMPKHIASPCLAGRPQGHWFKWKRDALSADCVMMYAQHGSGI